MKMTNPVSVSRVKSNEKSSQGFVLSKADDLNNIVIMSGSAKRRRLGPEETVETPTVKITEAKDFNEHFSELRVPFCKSHQKLPQGQERLMTKSCEVLLECIKPYKEIRMAQRTQVTESTRTIRNILTTDVIYERKATRKVEFISFHEESAFQNAFFYKQTPMVTSEASAADLQKQGVESCQNIPKLTNTSGDCISTLFRTSTVSQTEHKQSKTGKAVSSEDFITRVFTDPESVFI